MTGATALTGLVDRVRGIAIEGLSHPDARSLLHAYIACRSVPDLCRTIGESFAAPSILRLALRRRLERLLRDGDLERRDREHVHDLIEQSRTTSRENASVRPHVEALLSAVFEYLQPPQQQSIIENWIDRGTRGAAARWLKATTQVLALFDETAVMAYFRSSDDVRVALSTENGGTHWWSQTIAGLFGNAIFYGVFGESAVIGRESLPVRQKTAQTPKIQVLPIE
jgi:hypothetical protein